MSLSKNPHSFSPSQLILDSLRAPIESYLLTDSVELNKEDTVLDIGCGSGIIALSLAVKYPKCKHICGIDIVSGHLDKAFDTYQKLKIIEEDISEISFVLGDICFYPFQRYLIDVIVSNPPFFAVSNGMSSPLLVKKIAHMEETLSLQKLFFCAKRLLKSNGKFVMVYPLSRLKEVESCCIQFGWIIKKQTNHLEVRKRSGGITIIEMRRESLTRA